jgi:hypothetical protein
MDSQDIPGGCALQTSRISSKITGIVSCRWNDPQFSMDMYRKVK